MSSFFRSVLRVQFGRENNRPPEVAAVQVTEAQLLASICRDSFSDFCRTFWPTFVPETLRWNWHLDVICDELQRIGQRVARGEPKEGDLVLNVSPGSSKSSIISVLFPAWLWTQRPSISVIGASYAHPLALDLARKNRDVVTSELYSSIFPEIQLRGDMNTKGYFANQQNGYRFAVGSGGSVLGYHADLVTIDDPLDPNRALSDTEIYQINHWITNTLSSRKKEKLITPMILVMQRLHQNDPTALFLESGRVRHICLPATTEYPVKPASLVSNYVDGMMDPVRLPLAILDEERKRMGEYAYGGQYGQSPVPAGGGMFKTQMIRALSPPERFRHVVRFWDKAATAVGTNKASRRSAWTVGTKMAMDHTGMVWILDVARARWDSYERERQMHRAARRDGRHVEIGVEQEPGSSGKDSALATVKRLKGFRVRILPASGRKETRADEFSIQVNAGNVAIPAQFWREGRWVGWVVEFMEELRHWPFSTYKDQGDSASGGFAMLARSKVKVGTLRMKARSKVV